MFVGFKILPLIRTTIMPTKTRKNSRLPPKTYMSTAKGLFHWANSELEHIGRIASVEDPDLQYSYAMSTLNGMAHLKDAIYEYINRLYTNQNNCMKADLLKLHEKVIRVMKHLVKTYKLDLNTIRSFNTRHTLSNLSYLENSPKRKSDSKNNRKLPKSSNIFMKRNKKTMKGGICPCMMRKNGGKQFGGDGQETTTFSVQGVPVTQDDKSVVVIGDYGTVTAKDFKEIMQDKEAGRIELL